MTAAAMVFLSIDLFLHVVGFLESRGEVQLGLSVIVSIFLLEK